MSLGNVLTLNSVAFNIVDFGRYVASTSTADQPITVSVDSTIKANATSSFVVKYNRQVNSASVGMPDSMLQVHTVVKFDPVFTAADIIAAKAFVDSLYNPTNVAAIMQGRR